MGLRASGKSTAGAVLAERLDLSFVDLDARVAHDARVATAADLIRRDGLPAFRAAEQAALASVIEAADTVIALGGGTPTISGAERMLRAHTGPVVYLRAKPSVLASRLAGTDLNARPSLTGRGVVEEVNEIFAERDPLYCSIATSVLEIGDTETVDGVVDAIVETLRS